MNTEATTTESAAVTPQGAHVALEKAASKRGLTQTKVATKSQKAAKKAGKPAALRSTAAKKAAAEMDAIFEAARKAQKVRDEQEKTNRGAASPENSPSKPFVN